MTTRCSRIAKAVSSGALARLLSAGLSLVSISLAVRYLGGERYGVWATVTTTVVWLNLLDFGIANSLTNCISHAYAMNDKASAARHFTNALLLTIVISSAAGIACIFLLVHVNWMALFNVAGSVGPAEVRNMVAVAVAMMTVGLPCNLAAKVQAGYQEVHRNNYVICFSTLAGLAGLAVGIRLRVSMPILFVMSVGCLTFGGLANLLLLMWQKPWLLPRPSLIDRAAIAKLLHSGWPFFLIQAAGVVVLNSDNLVVSHYLGAAAVTPYSVAWRLAGLAVLLQSLLFPALWPAYAEAYARREYGWIRQTFARVMTATMILNVGCFLVLAGCGRTLIRIWAGADAVPTLPLLFAMGAWAVISGFMSVESCLLAAIDRTREQGILSTLAAILNITLSIVLVRRVGSVGVIGGTILSYLFVLVTPQTVIVRNLLKHELGNSHDGISLLTRADQSCVEAALLKQEEGIGAAFFADGGGGAVSGNNQGVIWQGQHRTM